MDSKGKTQFDYVWQDDNGILRPAQGCSNGMIRPAQGCSNGMIPFVGQLSSCPHSPYDKILPL
jgi:hypothetical protein